MLYFREHVISVNNNSSMIIKIKTLKILINDRLRKTITITFLRYFLIFPIIYINVVKLSTQSAVLYEILNDRNFKFSLKPQQILIDLSLFPFVPYLKKISI